MAEWRPVRLSAMHHQHVAMGAVMDEREGWQMPARFGTVEEELRRLQAGAGLLDISPITKLSIQGENASAFLRSGLLRRAVARSWCGVSGDNHRR